MLISRWKVTVFAFAVLYFNSTAACYSFTESNLPNAEEPKATKIQELEKERELTLRKIVALNEELRTRGIVGGGSSGAASFMAESYQAERAWLNAQLALSKTDPERVAVQDQHLKLAKEQEDFLTKRVTDGVARNQPGLLAKACRLGAEIDLERAKAKAGGQPIPPDDAKDVRVKKLAQEQVETLRKAIALDNELLNRGIVGSDSQFIHQQVQNQRALMAVESALCENDTDRIAVTEKALAVAKKQEEYFASRVLGGIVREQSVLTAKANRLGVEIDVERAKAKAGGQPILVGDAKAVRIKKLAQEQVECLDKLITFDSELRDRGVARSDNWLQLAQNQRALLTIELALCENDKERVAVIEKVLTLAKRYEDFVTKLVNGGIAREQSVMIAKTNRLEFEIELEKAKETAPK